jgi:hypothetical protein
MVAQAIMVLRAATRRGVLAGLRYTEATHVEQHPKLTFLGIPGYGFRHANTLDECYSVCVSNGSVSEGIGMTPVS